MTKYIDKSALVAEIKKLQDNCLFDICAYNMCGDILSFLDTLETKEVVECKQPEYSYFKTTYQCGKKPRWNIGDTLAYYEFYTDREGEHVLGKVTKVDFDKEQCDWFYTLEGGSVCDEQSLLENETYKKN